jgi:putative radical SAM enzyme (TIGR03279 family)
MVSICCKCSICARTQGNGIPRARGAVSWDVPSPLVVAVAPGSPADTAGLLAGDEIVALNGVRPRDVIEWQLLTDEADLSVEISRGGLDLEVGVAKADGEPLGVEVSSALFDQVRTCDNHCEFCFIFQLPPGLRKSLYVKDDDYRLSFLYGNYTTLTRFTELDLERVVTERLGPLNVSIHATDPEVRARMLSNRRGATSLRWLRALLDHGIEVHGQVVVCPGVNDADVLEDTLCGVLDRFPELATVCVVPLGISRWSPAASLREHTLAEAAAVVDTVAAWQEIFLSVVGRRVVFAADEYYLLAGRPFPAAECYEGFPQHEDGVGMARAFESELRGDTDEALGTQPGFFAWVDGAGPDGYRAPRAGEVAAASESAAAPVPAGEPVPAGDDERPVTILTGEYGARVLTPLVADLGRPDVRVLAVANNFFGGNIAVTGLLVGADLAPVLAAEPEDRRYLLPDVCLSKGLFLDGTSPADLPRPVEIVATDGVALRRALGAATPRRGPLGATPAVNAGVRA